MPQQIKIYSPPGHAVSQYWQRFLIHPVRAFWGDGSDRWDEYAPAFEFYKELFTLCETMEESDVVFLPMAINYYVNEHKLALAKQTCKQADEHGLKTYIWIEGDYDFRIQYKGAIYLKNASFKSKNIKNEIIRPGDVKEDLLQTYFKNEIKPVLKSEKPKIGFDGLASYPISRLIGLIGQNILKNIQTTIGFSKFDAPPVFPMLLKRNQILNRLESSVLVETDFNKRKTFAKGTVDKDLNARRQFLQNIRNNHYTVCLRGSANYSLRFYETLCLGRIPLFINTDCVLPFENDIDYKKLTLWVEEKDIKYLPQIIQENYLSIHPDDFCQIQIDCRKTWETYFTSQGYYSHLVKKINKKNSSIAVI